MEVWNKSKTWGGVHKCQFMHLDLFLYFVLSFILCHARLQVTGIMSDMITSNQVPRFQTGHAERGISLVTKSRSKYIGLQQGTRNYRWQAPTAEIRNTCSIWLECLVLRLYGQCELCITLFSVKSYHELSSQNYKRMNIELIKEINLYGAGWKDMYQSIFMTTINICVVRQRHKFSQRG